MPYLPGGGGQRQLELLDAVLYAIRERDGIATARVKVFEVDQQLGEWAKLLIGTGLVTRVDRDHFLVSEEAEKWMASGDPAILLGSLHRHIRYVGELLDELTEGRRTVRSLQEEGNRKFDLRWATLDQVRRRITWFICLGLMEYKTSQELGLTDLGTALVSNLAPGAPDTAPAVESTSGAVIMPDIPAGVSDAVATVTQAELLSRNPVLGYIPRGNGDTDVVQALTLLVNACQPQVARADLLTFARKKFGVSEASFGPALTTLTRSGLIEQTGVNLYSPTSEASAWLEDGSPLSLVLLLHSRYKFMLEIIPLLGECDQAPTLARAAAQQGWLTRADAGGVRTRIQLLKAAGLIFERANWRYQATPLGELVAQEFPTQVPADDDDATTSPAPGPQSQAPWAVAGVTELVTELENAATASDDPTRLERAVAEAFNVLGFEARHIGGGGKTDVLATVVDAAGKTARVIIDAKAASSGSVNEGAVSFDTLREHKKQHQADHVVIVGPNFDSGRTTRRAEEHSVRVLSVEELCSALKRHAKYPQSPVAYLRLVSASADAHREFDASWSQAERRVALLGHVTAVLASESQMRDEITGGALTVDQIYLIVRDEIDPRPAAADIEDVLRLLEHPLVGSVIRSTGSTKVPSYQLKDPVNLVATKLAALARAISSADSDA